jgi:hypothetical protein
MTNLLVQYFIKNGHLDLPSIGLLKWSKQAAYWEHNKFMAPKECIVLEQTQVTPSKHFYNFLAEELNISIDQAHLQFEAFIQQFMGQETGHLHFGNLGTVIKTNTLITWHNLYHTDVYFMDFELSISPEFEGEKINTHQSKDYWWVWTIGLIAVALALIIYKQI